MVPVELHEQALAQIAALTAELAAVRAVADAAKLSCRRSATP